MTYSNLYTTAPDTKPITIDDLRQAVRDLGALGSRIARLDRQLFFMVAERASTEGITWLEMGERIVQEAQPKDRAMVADALANAWARVMRG